VNNINKLRPFHLAIPVDNLADARAFYGDLLGCIEGRSNEHWVDFNFFGHQLVVHLDSRDERNSVAMVNPVDGHGVPIPHFGIVTDMDDWAAIRDRLQAAAIQFVIEPTIRFRGQTGEQATLFFRDPAGNNLEIKAFASPDQLFAK
jgi:extradiol dioxygenase family protein